MFEPTAAQRDTLEDLERYSRDKSLGFKVVGHRDGNLVVRSEETFLVLPSGLTTEKRA
jgi:hypothetical protein